MNKKTSLLTVILLSLNVILDPLIAVSTVFAQEDGVAESSVIMETVPPESVPEETIIETPQPEEEAELPPAESTEEVLPEESIQEESSVEETLESEESEEPEEEEEDKTPVTGIGFESAVTDNINTGSEFEVPVRVTNAEAALEGALLRFTVDGQYIAGYDNMGSYFPYAEQAASNVYNSGSNLIIEYNLSDLSQEYNGVTTLSLNTIDNGSMVHGTQIPVIAEVIQNGNTVAQTSYRNYNFVTRQPNFATNVSYPQEATSGDDNEEGPAQQTEIAYSFSFANNGSGNGTGQSAVTDLTVSTHVPESLTFDASLNAGWSYNEGTRTATYSVTPESGIYSNGYNLPANLILTAAQTSEDIQEAIYAEAVFTFANGDVVTKTNQPEVMMTALEDDIQLLAELSNNLIANLDLQYTTTDGTFVTINNGDDLELDLNDLNAISLDYSLQKTNDLVIAAGDTYTIPLPPIAHGLVANNVPITFDGIEMATYSIVGTEVIITFNEEVNSRDDVELHVVLQGQFNKEVFESNEEVIVEVPYNDGTSFTATLRPQQQEFDGEDRKMAGSSYILNEDGSQIEVDRNPTHIDWTVIANDSMGTFDNATIVDELGPNLEIVSDSFVIERIIRNYNNDEIGREPVTGVTPILTDNGFELPLGAVEDAYSITYTTRIIRPDGGGTHTINNNANIILDGSETPVSDSFDGTWSGDLPAINKEGNLVSDQNDRIEWQVEYNYGKESLGTVTLSDQLTHGELDPETIQVYQVDTDIDGNIVEGTQQPVDVTPIIDGSQFSIPDLDAEGNAYYITFQSSVPIGLNDTVINTISDNLNPQNSDDAAVPVNTIPAGGKVGEQDVDENGNPYIEWTITMNSEQLDVPRIEVRDVFDAEYLSFDPTDNSLYELYQDGEPASNFSIESYTHDDGRTGFYLNVTEAGPHEYQFVYRTYYTVAGMNQPNLANNAELVFRDRNGEGIGETIVADVSQEGPNAGIRKSGEYVYAEENPTVAPQIRWTVVFNETKTLLNSPTLTDTFTSNNYAYVDGSVQVQANNAEFTNYTFTPSGNGFNLNINEDTNATFTVTYLTTVDIDSNADQTNSALLTWQGGGETADATVGQRQPGISKQAEVTIDSDGSKSIDWVVGFNENRQVLHGVSVTDEYSPSTATLSNVQLFRDGSPMTANVTDSGDGSFTVEIGNLDPVPYQLTYTTTLSPEEELSTIENLATITYTGGSEEARRTVPNPELGVSKQATNLDKEAENPVISWQINANTDTENYPVNLVNAVLTDTIPGDQALIQDSIVVTRLDGTNVTDSLTIETSANDFTISPLNGSYQYVVTFNTEILEYPSFHPTDTDRYENSTTLTNTGYEPVSADAYQDYFYEGGNNGPSKSGVQNEETENIDWTIGLNQAQLTINNFEVRDALTGFHSYLPDTFVVTNTAGVELAESEYNLTIAEDNRSFTLTIGNGTINEAYQLSYSTRLDPDKLGSYTVFNRVEIFGGANQSYIDGSNSNTTAQQWFFGGGGSGRVLDLNFTKLDLDSNEPLEGVAFSLYSVRGSGEQLISEFTTLQDGTRSLLEQRAGRYILRETATLPDYVVNEDIYFVYGYGEDNEVTIDLSNPSWNPENYQRVQGESLIIYNEKQKTTATATKVWEGGSTERPTVYFQLLRQVGDGEAEVVPDAEVKELVNGTTSVTWNDLVAKNSDGIDYTFTVQEVDAEGNDYTPFGYTKVEEGLTVTNTASPIELSVRKEWDDAENQDGNRPDSVEVQLTANGAATGEPVELSAANNWAYTFEGLPAYNDNGEMTYSVQENNLTEGYEANVTTDDNGVLVLTNTYNPLSTSLTVNKAWNDAEDQDGIRPTSVTVQLMAGEDAQGEPVELNAENAWSYTWTDLAVNAAGNPIEYTVEETTVPEGYEATTEVVDGVVTITNTHAPAVTTIPVNKVWDDVDNQDGLRPESITANLLADGTIVESIVLDESNEWAYEFQDQPVYVNGEEITYTITENTVENYSTTIENGTITNSYTPEETSVTVTKDWQDGGNQDGNRPESIQVVLTADGEATEYTAELTEDNNWTASWQGLPLNEAGAGIAYSVVEEGTPEGYQVVVNDEDHGNIIVTNTYNPAVQDVTVNKVWEDDNDRDGLRPESIQVQLIADGQIQGDPVVLDESTDWSYTWTDLAVNAAGEAIAYTVAEVEVPEGYTSTIGDTTDNVISVTNSHDIELRDINVTKVWDDSDNQDGLRPESIQVQLSANGEVSGEAIELNAENDWTHTWEGLVVNDAGTAVEYAVSELAVPEEYTVSINDEDVDNVIITNSFTPQTTQVSVEKAWNDAEDQDGIRPTSVTVQLMAGEDAQGEPVELNAENAWSYTWTDLAVNAAGNPIEYTVEETTVPEGYDATTEVVDGVITITNTHAPAVTTIPVNKVWDDVDNQDGLRPESITANLLADGTIVESIVLDASNEWAHEFQDQPVYVNGEEITYTITENTVENYSTTIENGTITNSYTPEETSVTVTKDWQDGNNQDGNRPESIQVVLTADGEATEYTAELTEENNWTASWQGLPLNSEGEGIDYSVLESNAPEGYEVAVNNEDHGNIIVTNTYNPAVTQFTVNKVWDDQDDRDGLRPENIQVQLIANDQNQGDPVVLDESTDWSYTWTDLAVNAAGEAIAYTVAEVEVPEGYEATIGDIEDSVVTITNFHEPIKVSVGDYVWIDENRDGLQDGTGIPLAGVVLTIEDAEGNPVTDVYGNPVDPQTTDENGYYSFDDLPADNTYTVRIDREASAEVLEGYIPTLENQGGDNGVDSSTWEATSRHLTEDGDRDPTLDFGFVRPSVSVGDYVWIDSNKDGLQDDTDVPLSDVILTIVDEEGNPVTDVFGNPVEPQTTDENGYYSFDNLPADKTYTVRIDREVFQERYPELAPTTEGAGEGDIDSSTWEATSRHLTEDGDRDPTLDFGFVRPSVSVGDYVWFDENKDGLQDPEEPGIPGVVLEIRDEEGNPVTDIFGNPVEPQTTDADGGYRFDNLPIDKTYTVTISPEQPALEGYEPTSPEQGDDRGSDSSTWEATSVPMTEDGQHDPTLDFGFVIPETPSVSVGDYVWIDENNDGLQDETDIPLAGVVLTIRDSDGNPVTDIFGNPVEPQTTDENGYYSFDNLPTDKTYVVTIDREASAEVLEGLEPTIEEAGEGDVDSSTWTATSRHLVEDGDRDPTLDFGFVRSVIEQPSVSVGDYVWIDENRDGLQDETDVPLAGVVLTIEDSEGNPVTDVFGNPVEPQTTDNNGYYSFDNLPIDNTYVVRIDREAFEALYPELSPTLEEQGDENGMDSSTWTATSRHLTEDGDRDPTLDFGFVRPEQEVISIVGEKVWQDNDNANNTRPESITVELVQGGEVIDTLEVTANEDGQWLFEFNDLPVLEENQAYEIREVAVEDYETTINEVAGVVIITNTYTPSTPTPTPSTTVRLQAHKVLEGRQLKANEFEFEIVAGGSVVARAKNTVDGTVDFGSIRYTAPGTYEYTIREVEGNDDKVTYDSTEYMVTVEVTREGNELVATVTYHTAEGDVPVFTNTVEPTEPTEPTDPTDPTDPEEPGKPGKPSQSGDSDLPATGEQSYVWFGVLTMVMGLGFLLSEKYLSKKKQ